MVLGLLEIATLGTTLSTKDGLKEGLKEGLFDTDGSYVPTNVGDALG